MNVFPPTDRDSYRTKRVHGSGVSLAKAFKAIFNTSVIAPIINGFKELLKQTAFEELTQRNIIEAFSAALSKIPPPILIAVWNSLSFQEIKPSWCDSAPL